MTLSKKPNLRGHLFLTFLLTLLLIFPALIKAATASAIPTDVQAAGVAYQRLSKVHGHFDGVDFNPAVDAFNGEKHRALTTLGKYFGRTGTPVADIVKTMGPASIEPVLPDGGSAPESNVEYHIYKWRGYHDYFWFKVDKVKQKVLAADWYMAYD